MAKLFFKIPEQLLYYNASNFLFGDFAATLQWL